MSVGKDMISPNKRMNDKYSYDGYGVRSICESYYELREMEDRNWQAVDIRIDFEQALSATILSPESRLMVGLRYGFGLSIMQISKLTKIKMLDCKVALDESYEVIEAVMNGYETTFFYKFEDSTAKNIDEWIQGVLAGKIMPYDIPDNVMDNMWHYLVSVKDRQVMSILNPKPQENVEEDEDGFGGYPFHQTSDKVEDPNRSRNFNPYREYDYFFDKDRNRIVYYDALAEPEALLSNLKTTGRRKSGGASDQEDDTADFTIRKSGRSNIYEQ